MKFYCWKGRFLCGIMFNVLIKLLLIDAYYSFYFCFKQWEKTRFKQKVAQFCSMKYVPGKLKWEEKCLSMSERPRKREKAFSCELLSSLPCFFLSKSADSHILMFCKTCYFHISILIGLCHNQKYSNKWRIT